MSEVGYPAGQSGAFTKTDQGNSTGDQIQIVKPAFSAPTVETLSPSDASGIAVNASIPQAVMVADSTSAPLPVRLSNGSGFIDTIPVTIQNVILPVSGAVSVLGPLSVDGDALLMNQGAAGSAWPVNLTDGQATPHLTMGPAGFEIDLNPVQASSPIQPDKTPFLESQTSSSVLAAVVDDSGSAPPEDDASFLRMTAKHSLHVQLHRSDGSETAIAARTMPVSFSLPHGLVFSRSYGFIGGSLNVPIFTPPPGTTVLMQGWSLTIRQSGYVTLSEGTAGQGGINLPAPTDDKIIYKGKPPTGQLPQVNYFVPNPLTVPNNYIRLDTDTAATGDLVIWGITR